MLIPENYKEPGQIILTYDGNESSVFAIKQFAYVFPELCKNETMLLSLADHENELPEYSMVTELVSRHYPNLKILSLPMTNKKEFTNWAKNQQNSFIIMGAFSRSLFSELFKRSFANNVIHDIKMPIFISHK